MTTKSLVGRLALAATLGSAVLVSPVQAQDFPTEPISLVVNWPAGGGMDRAGRLVAEHARKHSPVPFAVVNVDGAGGATGVRHVADAKADGYTIGILGASIVTTQYMNPNANGIADVEYLAFFGPDPAAFQVRSDTGITSVDELVKALKDNPRSLKNGNDAPGGISHIAASLFEAKTGTQLSKIPYQGYGPTVAAIVSGEVTSATLPVNQLIDQHQAGDVKILAVMGNERHFMAPDVPTFKEAGIDLIAGDWRAFYIPHGVPEDRKAALEKILLDTLNDPELVEAAKQMGFTIEALGAADTKAYVERSDADLYPILNELGLVKARQK